MIYAARGVLLTYEHEVELVGWGNACIQNASG